MEEKVFHGIGVSEGIRIGKAYIFERPKNIDTNKSITENDVDSEINRFKESVKKAAAEVNDLISRSEGVIGDDKIGVLKGQKSILADPAYTPEIEKLIRKKLFSSEKAVSQVTGKFAAVFENMKNEYMKERAADIKDAGNRLLNILSGVNVRKLSDISSPVILIADDLAPSDTITLNKDVTLAFATQKGGKTSHTSIFAKSMGIPAVVGICEIAGAVNNDDEIIIDGAQGVLIVSPAPETKELYEAKMKAEFEKQSLLSKYAYKDAYTGDGIRVIVAANIGSAADADYSSKQGAEAVGLFRTEQIYLSKSTFPDENEQFFEYKKIAETYSEKEVIVRTLDIGGDKAVSYLNIPKEENPFLGYRAIRLCLDQKSIFLTQLRAILRASAFGNLKIMFPMISSIDELLEAKKLLTEAAAQLESENIAFNENIKTGMMVEVPSVAIMADMYAKEVDFFSIGTNDLVQYTLAVDRGNEKISHLYSYFNPAVIHLIKNVSDAAHNNGIPVGMCGGMAGDPLAVPLLIGLNLDELSMAAGAIADVKYIISQIQTVDCQSLAGEALKCKTANEVTLLLNNLRKS